MTARRVTCPAALEDLLRTFVAEEAASVLRHTVANKVAAARNGAFYIQRKLETEGALMSSDKRLAQFLKLIDDELGALRDVLKSRLPEVAQVQPNAAEAGEVGRRVVADLALSVPVDGGEARVKGNPDELALALFFLLENAVEAEGSALVQLKVTPQAGTVRLDVVDKGGGIPAELKLKVLEPAFTTKPGHSGVGLKVSRRIARRWGGELELADGDGGGTRASLVLPLA